MGHKVPGFRMKALVLFLSLFFSHAFSQPEYFPDFVFNEPEAPQVLLEDSDSSPTALLAGDPLALQTWQATRERLEPAMDELRILMLTQAEETELLSKHEEIARDFQMMLKMVPHQAPTLEAAFHHQHARITRQLELMMEDYRNGNLRQLQNMDRQILLSFHEWNQLLHRNDLERGDPDRDRNRLPADWNAGSFPSTGFAERIAPWNASQLLAGYEERRQMLGNSLRRQPTTTDYMIASEMGELARQLAQRTYEVPIASRQTFQNTALRLDVMAENLHDFLRQGNRLHARRQVRVMAKSVAQAEAFLLLRDQGL